MTDNSETIKNHWIFTIYRCELHINYSVYSCYLKELTLKMMFVRQPIGKAHWRLWLETWTSAGRHWAGATQGGSGSVRETGSPSTRGRAFVSAQLREHIQLGDQGRPGPVTAGPLEGGMAVRLGPAELARPAFPVWMGPRVLNRKEVGGQVLWTGWNLPFPSQVSTLTPNCTRSSALLYLD